MTDDIPVGFVYRWTNTVNGKQYIGAHLRRKSSKKDPRTDGYMGSGDQFVRAVAKYGKDAFQRDVLFVEYVDVENVWAFERDEIDRCPEIR